MFYNIVVDDTFFSEEEKENITIEVKKMFADWNKLFNENMKLDKEVPYFDEILIIKKENDTIHVLYNFFEDAGIERYNLEFSQLNMLIEEFVYNSPYDMYVFLNEQLNLDFDYITRGRVKDENVLILLNNQKYSLDEIRDKYKQGWVCMNKTNAILYNHLRNTLSVGLKED